MIGKKLSPHIIEIGAIIQDFNTAIGGKPDYTHAAFISSVEIFMSALMDKMWESQEMEGMAEIDRCNMATKAGEELRELIKTYTNIDTHEL